jgi:hypothetical protein
MIQRSIKGHVIYFINYLQCGFQLLRHSLCLSFLFVCGLLFSILNLFEEVFNISTPATVVVMPPAIANLKPPPTCRRECPV